MDAPRLEKIIRLALNALRVLVAKKDAAFSKEVEFDEIASAQAFIDVLLNKPQTAPTLLEVDLLENDSGRFDVKSGHRLLSVCREMGRSFVPAKLWLRKSKKEEEKIATVSDTVNESVIADEDMVCPACGSKSISFDAVCTFYRDEEGLVESQTPQKYCTSYNNYRADCEECPHIGTVKEFVDAAAKAANPEENDDGD